jgi:hypothetical protein
MTRATLRSIETKNATEPEMFSGTITKAKEQKQHVDITWVSKQVTLWYASEESEEKAD